MRPIRPVMAVCASALLLGACGVGDGGTAVSPRKGDDITLGLLLPDRETARFDKFDHPLFAKEVATLTGGKGKVDYANAGASAKTQSAQFQKMIADKVDVIVVDAVDSAAIRSDVRKAKDAGIPVIAYDRLAEGPIDAYVSHDNELVGEVQGRAIVQALGDKAESSKIVVMNGSPADPNTALFEKGALSELNGKVTIAAQYDTREWLPSVAEANMKKAVASIGVNDIAAVYAANDGIAGAVIDELKAAGATKIPPVTGQDANLDAVQRVVTGEQYMTVYKSFLQEATNAAQIAVYKVQGRDLQFDALVRDKTDSPTQKDIPSVLVPVVALTQENIAQTVVKEGVYTVKQICTSAYAADCAAIGLK